MIYTFRMVSDEADDFRRELQIDADDTFLSLRNVICSCVGYDRDQMSSFMLCDKDWQPEREITLEDMGSDSDEDVYLMEDSVLSDFLEDEGDRLKFVFDYMTDRCFFLELKRTEPGKSLHEPLCTVSRGKAPAQYVDMAEFEAGIDAKAAKTTTATEDSDLGEDFYGSDSYNEDEIDVEGYDEMNFNEEQ